MAGSEVQVDMPEFVDWLITILVVALVVVYLWYMVSLRRQPDRRRPRTEVYDRLGRPIAMQQNPDYHVNPHDKPEEPNQPADSATAGVQPSGPHARP
ncbi:MAG TPA: hypothetical protein VFX31_13365 [Ktedonobacterales bacterium]|nr:hypothetical protein [Ktedonobacterales bacterium]